MESRNQWKSESVLRLVMPVKPNGEHITTDFTSLNKSVIPSQFPLLVPEELFLQTKVSSHYMRLDLIKGYHQIELHPNSQPLTATHMSLGLRQYRHMPLSLVDSGATLRNDAFSRLWKDLTELSSTSMIFWFLLRLKRPTMQFYEKFCIIYM